MKKKVIILPVARAFFDTLCERAKLQFARIEKMLATEGFSNAPYTEKVAGYASLFAIRITHGQNARFFYCYHTGDVIYVLSGYEKKTEDIPVHEIRKALRLKKEYGL